MSEQAAANAGNGNGQTQAIVRGPKARLDNLKTMFEKSKTSIAAVLPKHLTPERLIKIVTSAASRTPDLLDCTPESVLLAVVQAGTLGLEPCTPLHHCVLVPFNNKKTGKKEAQLIVEYRGLCQLAYQSGEVSDIYAHEVCEFDDFDFEQGTNKWIRHKYDIRKDRGGVIGFYAVVKFKSGKDNHFEVMSVADVNRVRDASPNGNNDVWRQHPVEMGKKTAIRKTLKTAPMSVDKSELARALDHENKSDRGENIDILDVFGEEVVDPTTGEVTDAPKPKVDAMKDRLDAKAGNAA